MPTAGIVAASKVKMPEPLIMEALQICRTLIWRSRSWCQLFL